MSRHLYVLRHGKAEPDRPEDADRALTDRGLAEADRIGAFLKAEEVKLEAVLCSTAVRARQTWDAVAAALHFKGGFKGEVRLSDDLYLASVKTLQAAIAKAVDADAVLLVGHNPGLEQLVAKLIGASRSAVQLGTASLACIEFDKREWSDLMAGHGTLRYLIDPKVLR